MNEICHFSADEQAQINAKLAELQQKTGKSWAYEITKQLHLNDRRCLLEIAVDGKISRPVLLADTAVKSAQHICTELDRLYQEQSGSRVL